LEPVRKSSRVNTPTTPIDVQNTPVMVQSETATSTPTATHVTRQKKEQSMSLRKIWDEKIGFQLFDIKSIHNIQHCVKKGYCFDLAFYEDQKSCRELRMMITKVTKAFRDDERKRMRKEAQKQARTMSALGKTDMGNVSEETDENETSEELCSLENEWDDSLNVNINTPHIDTRSVVKRRRLDKSFCHVACQTEAIETLPNIPVRKKSKERRHCVEPRYLEAMALLMSENLSASEACLGSNTAFTTST